ncbi:unnamed protein product [Microthlaspi erraticum]|uniref:S1 motif domain-containing protein n=1 Tax=Microthlaspi erraticum TaxID=1685480 RepID=A0A6D2JGQ9_9BRAS|nr:unnamed protein product [Microthlaspi erraticum]
MEKEARLLLTIRAKVCVLSDYREALWKKVSSGPYRKKETKDANEEEAKPRIMACCWGPGNQEATFVMLDSSGELIDVLYARSIGLRYSQDVNEQKPKKNDQERLLKFMRDHQPDVVALGAVNLSCVRLKNEIYEVIFQMAEEMAPRNGVMCDLQVVYADESLPKLYENSRISSEEFPQQPGIVKRAVAIGRYLQNPLAMVAALCGPGKEILSWKLHSLQDFLDPEEKYEVVEQVMVEITNQVGIDVNFAASHEWLFSPLQFVSGLGPRKALSLQRSLVRAGCVLSRKELVNQHGLGKKVFVNAAGFLRIRSNNNSQFIDVLDDTRIHPESYVLAQELAKDVYDLEDEDDAVEHVRDRPYVLKKLVLDDYLRSKKQENKKETYCDIMRELSGGFQDFRSQFREASPDEEFYMISGETEETIGEGRVVQATVKKVSTRKAICDLDCGLSGVLMREDYSDDERDILDLPNKLCEGDVITCKIKWIQKERYLVFLTCKESEMRKNLEAVDDYYHQEEDQTEKEKVPKERKQFKSRMIVHPRFQNITAEQAREYLSDKSIGESIVRPSSRGLNHLTLVIKIFDDVYAHKEIMESGKEKKDAVMDRYVDPLVAHLMTMVNYRKFRNGTKPEIDDLLRAEKLQNPKMVAYGFGVSQEHPGSFILSYIRCVNPHNEHVLLYPKGFKFRNRMFGDLDRLVAYFKRHVNDDPMHYH